MFELLDGLPSDMRPAETLLDLAKMLDRFYLPPRCVDAHPSGSPYQYYTQADAVQGVTAAQKVITYCERQILSSGPS